MARQPLSSATTAPGWPLAAPWVWTGEPASTNDAPESVQPPLVRKVELGAQTAIPHWSQVLNDRHWLFSAGPFFLELFAGKAGITEAVFLAGVPVLPPVDIVASDLVRTPVDLVDATFWQRLVDILVLGVVFFLHCSTPCNTFTAARKADGGPPPLRSPQEPLGLEGFRCRSKIAVWSFWAMCFWIAQ